MSSQLASPVLRRRGVVTWRTRTYGALPHRRPPPPATLRMRRYLPLVVVTTGVVMVLPAVVVSAITPRGSPLWLIASGLSAVALSMATAAAGAALWKRHPHSRDVVFSDLLLWGWLRRCWTERRLSQARELYDAARKAGPAVSIELLTGLSRLLESRDPYTHGHGQRVARHAAQTARAMHVSTVEIAKIRTAAAIHDVGKLYTPREILNNPSRLDDAEYEIAKRHAAWGARMLADVGDPEIAAMVRHHHERIDGGGYPDGLAGSEIPVGARIIAVADTFDAITSSRAYRAARSHKRALDVLSAEAGAQLDPDAVAAFRGTYSARRSIGWLAFVAALPERLVAGVQAASQGFGSGASAIASILPGVGAASLIALSPSLHQNPLALQGTHPQSAPAVHRSAGTTRSPGATIHAGGTSGAKPTPGAHRRKEGTGRRSPAPSRAGKTRRGAPVTPSSGATPRSETGGGSGSSPSPKLPVTPPEVKGVPPVNPPPVTPPVQIPAVPAVELPPVQVPGTGVTPPVGTPGVKLPVSG